MCSTSGHLWLYIFLMHTELSNINWPAVIQLLWPIIYTCEGLYKSHSLNNRALMFHSVPHRNMVIQRITMEHVSFNIYIYIYWPPGVKRFFFVFLNKCNTQIANVNNNNINLHKWMLFQGLFLKKRNRLMGTEEIMEYQCFSWYRQQTKLHWKHQLANWFIMYITQKYINEI